MPDFDFYISNVLFPALDFPHHGNMMGFAHGAKVDEGANVKEVQDFLGNDIGVIEMIFDWCCLCY